MRWFIFQIKAFTLQMTISSPCIYQPTSMQMKLKCIQIQLCTFLNNAYLLIDSYKLQQVNLYII